LCRWRCKWWCWCRRAAVGGGGGGASAGGRRRRWRCYRVEVQVQVAVRAVVAAAGASWRGPGRPAGGPASRRSIFFLFLKMPSAESQLASRHVFPERIPFGSRQRALCRPSRAVWPLPRAPSRHRLCSIRACAERSLLSAKPQILVVIIYSLRSEILATIAFEFCPRNKAILPFTCYVATTCGLGQIKKINSTVAGVKK
jgi:hypothetical protein